MRVVNMHEAKSNLSKLVEEALEGEEVIIAKAGKPVAKLIPYEPKPEPRRFGAMGMKYASHRTLTRKAKNERAYS